MNQLAPVDQKGSRSIIELVASRYNMEKTAFIAVVRDQVSPKGRDAKPLTNEQLAALMVVANEYGLNPLTKEIYAFPAKGGGVVPILSIDGWAGLVARHKQADGYDFTYTDDEQGSPIACTCTMYRKDRSHPIVVTEYFAECRQDTQPWRSHPRRMLRHKSLIQAARYAFGFSGIYDEDEGSRIAEDRAQPSAVPSIPDIPDNPIVDVEANKPTQEHAQAESPKDAPDVPPVPEDKPQGRSKELYDPRIADPQSEPQGDPEKYAEKVDDYIDRIKAAETVDLLNEVWDEFGSDETDFIETDRGEISNAYDERLGAFEG